MTFIISTATALIFNISEMYGKHFLIYRNSYIVFDYINFCIIIPEDLSNDDWDQVKELDDYILLDQLLTLKHGLNVGLYELWSDEVNTYYLLCHVYRARFGSFPVSFCN